eukprot:CAMPEP_0202396402 /NCGR_PEP_ID=MMETSP1127-20130417/94488_1 /ASSEMBLY_ACC=CAM_ASM_000462 /TAXON_ID=3047 /ORGANISM="Dunaliella tertiolecta, Strain CCMP1320" /LENGTH=32 /DNA_ID= /DNA_START= /DNA_END= /DNA_ORIENTATION=
MLEAPCSNVAGRELSALSNGAGSTQQQPASYN